MSEQEYSYFSDLSAGLTALSEWERLPDIGLYMDQVVTYLERELDFLPSGTRGKIATPSMINNYAKANLIPRTSGKKYSREHIALLLAAFTLKRVLSVQDMAVLMEGLGGTESTRNFYVQFRDIMEHSVREMSANLKRKGSDKPDGTPEPVPAEMMKALALRLAVDASLRSFTAELLLNGAESLDRQSRDQDIPAQKKKGGRKAREKG